MKLCQGTEFSDTVRVVAVQTESLARVIGQNCKAIRLKIGVTQDELARFARNVGLRRWKASAVGDFEAGRSAPTFATVLAVTLALQMALEYAAERRDETPDWGVTLADLVTGTGFVELTDSLAYPTAMVADVCRGEIFDVGRLIAPKLVTPAAAKLTIITFAPTITVGASQGPTEREIDELTVMLQRSGLTEHRLARRLGISPAHLAATSFRLWQSTFSEERDRRAGSEANQQKRGRVSRELRTELEKALADGDD